MFAPFKNVFIPGRVFCFKVIFLSLSAILTFAQGLAEESEEPAYEPAKFFRTQILPILETKCFECHSEKEGQYDGGLVLDTKAGVLKGGDHGLAVVPFSLPKSSLIRSIRSDDKDQRMPPEEKLTPGEIALLSTWILLGAPDPRPDETGKADSP